MYCMLNCQYLFKTETSDVRVRTKLYAVYLGSKDFVHAGAYAVIS